MTIMAKPLEENFKVEITNSEEKLVFTFIQLPYRIKSLITSLVTHVKNGSYSLDATMQIFYNIKYALKNVEGILDAEGNPYKLEFENGRKEALTDKCVDELLATVFSDQLLFTARQLSEATLPKEMVNPLTGKPIKGVEIMPSEGVKKK